MCLDEVFVNGQVVVFDVIVVGNFDFMYLDEFIVGYQFQLSDDWSMVI